MTGMLMFAAGLSMAVVGVWSMMDAHRYYRKAQAMFEEVNAMCDDLGARDNALVDRIEAATGIRP